MSDRLLLLVYYILIAFVIGTVAQVITGYHKRRTLTTLILGFIGVVAGDIAAKRFHLFDPLYFFDISVGWAIVGAVLFILVFRLIRGRW